jgi:hypothetical protein
VQVRGSTAVQPYLRLKSKAPIYVCAISLRGEAYTYPLCAPPLCPKSSEGLPDF